MRGMGETAKCADTGVLETDLWETPAILSEEELRLHAGELWWSGPRGIREDEE